MKARLYRLSIMVAALAVLVESLGAYRKFG
jgi:hypothetical protein